MGLFTPNHQCVAFVRGLIDELGRDRAAELLNVAPLAISNYCDGHWDPGFNDVVTLAGAVRAQRNVLAAPDPYAAAAAKLNDLAAFFGRSELTAPL